MEKYKVLIIEDELIVAEDLKEILENAAHEVIGIATNDEEAMTILEGAVPDIMLVDISIKGKRDGIQLVSAVREKFAVPFIYITSHATRAVIEKAKLTQPYGYIVKPYREQDVLIAVELAIANAAAEQLKQGQSFHAELLKEQNPLKDHLFIRDKGMLIKIKFSDILFLEAESNYTTVHLIHTKYTLRSTLKNAEEQLPADRFFRIHKSFIINLQEISKLDSSQVIIGKTSLPIGRIYQEELMKKLTIF
jgi:DNA-binding LytR/AlgR family response regulator